MTISDNHLDICDHKQCQEEIYFVPLKRIVLSKYYTKWSKYVRKIERKGEKKDTKRIHIIPAL